MKSCFGSFGLFVALSVFSAVFAGFLLIGAFKYARVAMAGFCSAPRQVFARSPGVVFLAILTILPLVSALGSGQPFHTRYFLVMLPPFLCLAASGAEWFTAKARFKRVFMVVVIVTTATNIWLMPAMYQHQGEKIERGEVFVPGFRKLEMVYQALKSHAGTNRPIRVDDSAYLMDLPKHAQAKKDAHLISKYIAVREKEKQAAGAQTGEPVTYILERKLDNGAADPTAVAWSGNGLVLTLLRH